MRSIAVDVHVPGKERGKLGRRPGEQVDDPAGESEVAKTSVRLTAGTGRVLAGNEHGGVARDDHREHPVQQDRAATAAPGRTTPMTPDGSGAEMLKNGPATGLRLPWIWANLSAQPAYQTGESIDAATSASRLGRR